MPKLIKDGVIAENTWQLMPTPEGDPAESVVSSAPVIVPLCVWIAQKSTLQGRSNLGVWLDSHESATQLGSDAQTLALIALHFPGFMDGRAFSSARLLRERYGFTGELRAIGHFIRDQLCYLRRCGVNAFDFANPETNLDDAIKSLADFNEYYQAGVDQPLPLFRRRS